MLKKLATVIVTTSIFMQTGVVYANTTAFQDLQGYDWAVPAITAMADSGVISGVGNNKFAPANNVTRVEFASMAIRAVGGGGTEAIEVLSNGAGNLSEIESLNGKFWGNSTICASQYLGLTDYFGTTKESWNKPATRAEMAYIVITVAEKSGVETFEIKEGIENNIGDYEAVKAQNNYLRSILKAYSNGIISGMNDRGDFAPTNNAKRAEAAVMMWRLLEKDQRADVVVKEKEVTPVQTGDNIGESGTVYPVEGQIGPDGKPITRDSLTGILGYGNGQTGKIYLGAKSPINGQEIKVGTTAWDDYGTMHIGDTYSERNGYIYWTSEWNIIDVTIMNKLKEEHPAKSNKVGLQADIEGNIIQAGSDAVAMYEIKDIMGTNMWQPLKN